MTVSTGRELTRRTGVRMLGAGGATAALKLGGLERLAATDRKLTAFALIGDRSHPANCTYTELSRTLAKEAGLSIDFRIDVRDLSAERLKRAQVAHCVPRWNDPPQRL
jgi:hypothetical protein